MGTAHPATRGLKPTARMVLASALVTIGVLVPAAWAFRRGADSRLSGGPESYGVGCTQCHDFETRDVPNPNPGPGGVSVIGAPRRYRAAATYEFGIRVFDATEIGAGFEISAEGGGLHRGALSVVDAVRTQFADDGFTPTYLTHTRDGHDDSVATWASNGGAYEFAAGWQAPSENQGPITIFASGNAVDGASISGDHYYWGYWTMQFAHPGDFDGDTDVDLYDVAAYQRCFSDLNPTNVPGCEFVDLDDDSAVSLDDLSLLYALVDGPTATEPAEFVLADPIRGGLLYDKWWPVTGSAAPSGIGNHPLYPVGGPVAGANTFRCKECHGWDYKGKDGNYGPLNTGHYTGIGGVFGTLLSPRELFDLLKEPAAEVLEGHNFAAYGLTDADLWDVTRFVLEQVVDTNTFINPSGSFTGNPVLGASAYSLNCTFCHAADGKNLPAFLGPLADQNPWEFLHKTRFGHPGADMPALELVGWPPSVVFEDDEILNGVGAFAQQALP